MKLSRRLWLKSGLWIFVVSVAVFSGCSSPPPEPRSNQRSVAIAITIPGGQPPTKKQATEVLAAMQREVAKHGFVLATDARAADLIVHVKFTPDLISGSGGRISVLSIDPNPARSIGPMSGQDQMRESIGVSRQRSSY